LYERIYEVVRKIPPGRVASYGQVSSLVGKCTPRIVGYAMAAVPVGSDVPWHRVINSQGKISRRSQGSEESMQRKLLEDEGIIFDKKGRVNLIEYGWTGMDDPGIAI